MTTYLIPIIISCAINMSLICYKKKKFINTITIQDYCESQMDAQNQNDFVWCADKNTQNQTLSQGVPNPSKSFNEISGGRNEHNFSHVEAASPRAKDHSNIDVDSSEVTISIAALHQSSVEIEAKLESLGERESLPDFIHATLNDRIRRENQEKCNAQILSAKRSLITNVCLIFFFMASHCIVVLLPEKERIYFCVIVFAIAKGAMPICTTIANFGTVQFVISQYLTNLKFI